MRKIFGVREIALLLGCALLLGFAMGCSSAAQSPGNGASSGAGGESGSNNAGTGSNAGSGSGSSGASGSNAPSGSIGSNAPSGSNTSGSSAPSGSSAGPDDGGSGATASSDASVGDATTTAGPSGSNVPADKFLPKATGTCPTLTTGYGTFAGQSVQTWVGTAKAEAPGPLLLYWHATGSNSEEVVSFLGQAQIDAITALGGLVASFTNTVGTGTNTGNNVWYTDDFKTADEVVACAIANLHIDTRHIYTAGGSAGALQATWMSYSRSGYLAVAAPISGGLTLEVSGGYGDPLMDPQDPSNVPSAIVSHGAPGADVVIIDFASASAAYEADIKKRGGLSVDCNNEGGHVGTAGIVGPAMWEFMKDHPFKVSPDPYAKGVPADFPKFCLVGPRLADGGAP